jgi:thiosulfate/3-mercaptopyruvate sulfurtransferase
MQVPLVIQAEELSTFQRNNELLIIDICQPTNWRQFHLADAQHIDPVEIINHSPYSPGELPPLRQLEEVLGRCGYNPEKHIVVYDDEGGGWAARLVWILLCLGHHKVSYLNGGLYAWYKDEHPLTKIITPQKATQTTFQQVDTSPFTVTLDEMQVAIDDENISIWDARSAEEYKGLMSGARRSGHIPGAFNLDWQNCIDRENNLRLCNPDIIKQRLLDAGWKEGQQIYTYCQSHHRSALSWFVTRWLKIPVKAYAGGWAQWGNQTETLITTDS